MLFKLAFRNVKRQISNYLIYFITVSIIVALVFALNNLIFSDLIKQLIKYNHSYHVKPLLICFSVLLTVVVAFVLSYVTSFLLRRRKQEFGLYLTLGMTRKNILAIFAGETAVTFVLSLGFGMLLGLGLYQILMAIFINYLEMDYSLGNYSLIGVSATIAMVVIMFAVSSLASLIYLRFAKISRLLGGSKRFEKTVKHPVIWLGVAASGLALLIASLVWFAVKLFQYKYDFNWSDLEIIILMFAAGVLLLPIGVAKSVIPVCIRRNEKKFTAKGTSVFTMRALSGRLNANSVMAGVLTLLLLLAIIASNIALTQSNYFKAEINESYPYDISMYNIREGSYSFEDELEVIEKYADIKCQRRYKAYHIGDYNEETNKTLVKESDYNALSEMLNGRQLRLNGGFAVCYEKGYEKNHSTDFSDIKLELNGVSYAYEGSVMCAYDFISVGGEPGKFLVVPDDTQIPEDESPRDYLAVMLKNARYDASGLYEEFNSYKFDNMVVRNIKRYEWFETVGEVSLLMLACMYVTVTFILLSMALLALKTLSMVTEDREKFKTLWRLGADDGMIFKSLFSQMFFFYFLPFALPFMLSGIMVPFLIEMIAKQGGTLTGLSLFGQVIGFTVVILVLYALYFTITYLIAKRDIKKFIT